MDTPDTPTPPPVDPAQIPVKGKTWPKTLGIITIIFGSLGFLGALTGPLFIPITKNSMQPFVEQGADADAVEQYMADLTSLSWTGAGIGTLLGSLLLVGGILLVRRKRTASALLQAWAVLKILGGGYIQFRNLALQKTQMSIMFSGKEFAGEGAEIAGSITSVATTVGLVFGLLWLAALPVFLIIWFNRARVKEDMEAW